MAEKKLMKMSGHVLVTDDDVSLRLETTCDDTDRCDRVAEAVRRAPAPGAVQQQTQRRKQQPVSTMGRPAVNREVRGGASGAPAAGQAVRNKTGGR